MMKYQTKEYHTIHNLNGDIHIGSFPPIAKVIEDAPNYLSFLLSYFSSPRNINDAKDYISKHFEIDLNEVEVVINELIDSKILVENIEHPEDRYARHYLYYDMIGLDPLEAQETLSRKKVGLVGMGGIGSNIATILAASGIGHLVFSDGDDVELSNLTRQFLYTEDLINHSKVESAVANLKKLNSEINITPVKESVKDQRIFENYFSDCDFVILSADSPFQINEWINNAAIKYNFSYSSAGYIENYGVIGPLVEPGRTACYECYKEKGDLYEYSSNLDELENNINDRFQAPSFGPLNSLVASIQSNEVIRFLLNLENKSYSTRLLVNSIDYKLYEETFTLNKNCKTCSQLQDKNIQKNPLGEKSLPEVYENEREHDSFNAFLLDTLMPRLVNVIGDTSILDIGCGTGEQAIYFAKQGAVVDAVDASDEMISLTEKKIREEKLETKVNTLVKTIEELNENKKYDYIVCNNILDYVRDLEKTLINLKQHMHSSSKLIVSVPHPYKDSGKWEKEYYNGQWNYNNFMIENYFYEGPITKSREDKFGNVVINELTTFKRTTETYFNSFINNGFKLVTLKEPQPKENDHSALHQKSSKVPYFQVFVLKKDE